MKIILKSNWDTPVQPPHGVGDGYFVGREREVSFLSNEILRKNQGAILVSGHRGVGKTSLVYKALGSLKSQKILPVLINASHLASEEIGNKEQTDEIIFAKQILVNLIRHLYSASIIAHEDKKIDSKTYTGIKKLYNKAVAKEYESSWQSIRNEERRLETVKSVEINLSSEIQNLIAWLVSYALAAATITSPLPNWLKVIFSLVLAAPAPLFFIRFVLNAKRTENSRHASSLTAEEIHKIDNSVGNLVFDLEEIHKKLSRNEIKTIYVIDELDKLGEPVKQNGKNPEYLKLFKHFKNLFTLSSAIFIFIGGDEVFHHFTEASSSTSPDGSYRPMEYTYFTSKYFLSRPTEHDLKKYLEEIVDNVSLLERGKNAKEFESFKRLLFFIAQSDYFDLVQQIKDRITEFDGIKPVIETSNFQQADLLKSNLQKAISVLFEKYIARSPSRWNENENILRALYQHANVLIETKTGTPITDDKRDSSIGAAIRNLNYFIYRNKLLLDSVRESPDIIESSNTRVRIYVLKPNLTAEVPDSLDFLSEIENKFIEEIKRFIELCYFVDDLYNAFQDHPITSPNTIRLDIKSMVDRFAQWGVDVKPLWNELLPIYNNLKERVPSSLYNREQIEASSQKAIQIYDALNSNVTTLLTGILKATFSELDLQSATLNQNSTLFTNSLSQFRQDISGSPHFVVFDKEFRRQILITSTIANEIIEKHKEVIWENASDHLILLTDPEKSLLGWKRKGLVAFPIKRQIEPLAKKIRFIKSWLLKPNL